MSLLKSSVGSVNFLPLLLRQMARLFLFLDFSRLVSVLPSRVLSFLSLETSPGALNSFFKEPFFRLFKLPAFVSFLCVMYKDLCIRNSVSDRREFLGLSQSELASRVGISRNALSSIEFCQAYPRVNVAFALAEALHTPIEDLFYIQELIFL